MDTLSTLIGFLVGTATGAAGQYFADKYTDQRREKQRAGDQARIWRDIEQRFPAVIAEMRSDFSPTENRHVRAFFVKESNTSLGFVTEPSFEYHTDKHPDLRAAVLHLAQHGFITDITPGNCPMYRVHETLVDALLRPNNSFKPKPLRGSA
jgi:hypothetical protein